MRYSSLVLIMLFGCCLCSCIEHRAETQIQQVAQDETSKQLIIGSVNGGPVEPLPQHILRSGGQAQHIRVLAWTRDPDGRLHRLQQDIRSPLVWWQRFPFDICSDVLLPGTYIAENKMLTHVQIPQSHNGERIEVLSDEKLDLLARKSGYALPLETNSSTQALTTPAPRQDVSPE